MELEEKIRFALSTLKPMAERTLPFLCQVLGTNDRRDGELVGTALRCILGGRRVIVTASHVLNDGFQRFNDLAVSVGHGERAQLFIPVEMRSDEEADLAICDLPEHFSVPEGCSFWPEARIDPTLERLSTDYLFVHGFPGVRGRPWVMPGDSRVMSKSLPYGVMQRLDDLPPDQAPFQFAMDFESTRTHSDGGSPEADLFNEPHGPRGLSGSPVWRIGASGRRAADWNFDWCELVGVVTRWSQPDRLLVATKATKVLELAARSRTLAVEAT